MAKELALVLNNGSLNSAVLTAPDGRKAWWVFDAPGEPVTGRIRAALRELA